MEQVVVKIDNLVKRYKELIALDHFSLEIREGEIFGLLGPNGSGKTTTINCLLSLLSFDKGSIQIFGKEMSPVRYDIKRQIGVIMQNVAVFQELTVYENIDYFCGLYIRDKAARKQYVMDAVHFTGLEKFLKFYPKKLSGGLLRRLNIAWHSKVECKRGDNYLHLALYGGSRADLHTHCNYGSGKENRRGNKRRTQADYQEYRNHYH